MDILIKAAQLILSLSILVVLHELGHFIPAKLFKTKVEKFYLFFNPWFSLFKIKKGETEYGIGWLPLGGYVKIAGMIDESMDKEQMQKPAESWEFRSKPAWQRLIIMVGGVTVNLILGLLIYVMVLFVWGKEYLPVENAKYGITCDSVLIEHGFAEGDIIAEVGGEKPQSFMQINKDILIKGKRAVKVIREGEELMITLPADIDQLLLDKGVKTLFEPRVPFIIDTVLPNTPASAAGLLKGDEITGVDSVSARYFHEFRRIVENKKNETISLGIKRSGEDLIIPVLVDGNGKVGVGNKSPLDYFEFNKEEYSFFQAIPAGITHGVGVLKGYVESFKLVFTAAGAKQMGGFGTIGGLFSSSWDWQNFWEMTALISIILAFMNILPIPALDGGHVMFLLYEMISGRKPNEKLMEYAQLIGMALLLALVLYANGNDLFKVFSK
jgi:regulator of sigma E protease